jgi:hypothetical protein
VILNRKILPEEIDRVLDAFLPTGTDFQEAPLEKLASVRGNVDLPDARFRGLVVNLGLR